MKWRRESRGLLRDSNVVPFHHWRRTLSIPASPAIFFHFSVYCTSASLLSARNELPYRAARTYNEHGGKKTRGNSNLTPFRCARTLGFPALLLLPNFPNTLRCYGLFGVRGWPLYTLTRCRDQRKSGALRDLFWDSKIWHTSR